MSKNNKILNDITKVASSTMATMVNIKNDLATYISHQIKAALKSMDFVTKNDFQALKKSVETINTDIKAYKPTHKFKEALMSNHSTTTSSTKSAASSHANKSHTSVGKTDSKSVSADHKAKAKTSTTKKDTAVKKPASTKSAVAKKATGAKATVAKKASTAKSTTSSKSATPAKKKVTTKK